MKYSFSLAFLVSFSHMYYAFHLTAKEQLKHKEIKALPYLA